MINNKCYKSLLERKDENTLMGENEGKHVNGFGGSRHGKCVV